MVIIPDCSQLWGASSMSELKHVRTALFHHPPACLDHGILRGLHCNTHHPGPNITRLPITLLPPLLQNQLYNWTRGGGLKPRKWSPTCHRLPASGRRLVTYSFSSLILTFQHLFMHLITIFGYQLAWNHNIAFTSTCFFCLSYKKVWVRCKTSNLDLPDVAEVSGGISVIPQGVPTTFAPKMCPCNDLQ